MKGFARHCSEAGLSLVAEHCYPDASSTKAGRDALAILLAPDPGLDVVVFPNDDMAMGGIFHCMHVGNCREGEAWYIWLQWAGYRPGDAMPLSTILSKRFLIGKTAAEKLLESRERPAEKTIINTGF